MRLITSNENKSEWPKRHNCEWCGAELEYDQDDVHVGYLGREYISCPNCNNEESISDKRVQASTWKITFRHTNALTCKDIKDTEIQEYVNHVLNVLSSDDNEDGDSFFTATGDLLVCGYKHDEGEIDIIVTKDYWEDSLSPEDYHLIK